ncbi:MAG: hypothetical protein ACM3TU_02710 [Bacillota bacterium]
MGLDKFFKPKQNKAPEETIEERMEREERERKTKDRIAMGVGIGAAAGVAALGAAGAFDADGIPQKAHSNPAEATDTIHGEHPTAGKKSTDAPPPVTIEAPTKAQEISIDTPEPVTLDLGKHAVTIEMPER